MPKSSNKSPMHNVNSKGLSEKIKMIANGSVSYSPAHRGKRNDDRENLDFNNASKPMMLFEENSQNQLPVFLKPPIDYNNKARRLSPSTLKKETQNSLQLPSLGNDHSSYSFSNKNEAPTPTQHNNSFSSKSNYSRNRKSLNISTDSQDLSAGGVYKNGKTNFEDYQPSRILKTEEDSENDCLENNRYLNQMFKNQERIMRKYASPTFKNEENSKPSLLLNHLSQKSQENKLYKRGLKIKINYENDNSSEFREWARSFKGNSPTLSKAPA